MRRLIPLLLLVFAALGAPRAAVAAAPCSPFTVFPLALNFGSGANTGTGEDFNCVMRKTQAAVNTRGQANGYPPLNASGKIPGQYFDIAQVPTGLPFVAAATFGVTPDTGLDVTDKLVAGLQTISANGAQVAFQCGTYIVRYVPVPNAYTWLSGGGQSCTNFVTPASYGAGPVFKFTGVYSGLTGASISHIGPESGVARTSGYTVDLANGYGFVRDVQMRHCFVCIRMGTQGGWAAVDRVMLQYMADGATNPGSGGILVENDSIGPANWISHAIIMSNFIDPVAANRRYPSFAVKLTNTGETVISDSDFISVRTNLLLQPGSGQTVQATRVNATYFDSAQADNVAIVPTGTGFVIDTRFVNSWITNTRQITSAVNTNGLRLDASGATGPVGYDTPIRGTSWHGGLIAATTGQQGAGVVCANATPEDTTISGATIAGWSVGVDLAPGCSHVTIADNAIGKYSPFNVDPNFRTNTIGVRVQGGPGNYINIHDNRLRDNTSAPLGFSATGLQNVVHDNLGYNPVGALQLTVGASPWTFTNGPTRSTVNLIGGGGVTVVTAAGNGAGNLTLCNTTPCTAILSPYQAIQTSYTSGPSAVQTIH